MIMTFIADPFLRGPLPVGVRSVEWQDPLRDRMLPVEIYYPAEDGYRGQDLDPAIQDGFSLPGSMSGDGVKRQMAVRDARDRGEQVPVVIFSHGYSGDRREFSFLCCYLASHGYRVISADHIGSTFSDIARQFGDESFDRSASMVQMCLDRYGDIPFMLDMAEREFGGPIEAAGCTGVSFGGWTSICAPALDHRIKAIAPQCPGGAEGPLGTGDANILGQHLRYDWKTPTEMLMLVGDRDNWLPLYGQLGIFDKCPGKTKKLMILNRADHQHFVDDMANCHEWYRNFTMQLAAFDQTPGGPAWGAIAELITPFEKLMPEAEAQTILCGYITQHMNAHLKGVASDQVLCIETLRECARARDLNVYVWGA
jgi:dienelactone hydrolase